MVQARNKLSTKYGGSVFYHILETEIPASEEVTDRNFRDLRFPYINAMVYVHYVFQVYGAIYYPQRFLTFNSMLYMPEVDNEREEQMLGVYSPDFYHEPDLSYFTLSERYEGYHLIPNEEAINEAYDYFASHPSRNDDANFQSFFVNRFIFFS